MVLRSSFALIHKVQKATVLNLKPCYIKEHKLIKNRFSCALTSEAVMLQTFLTADSYSDRFAVLLIFKSFDG